MRPAQSRTPSPLEVSPVDVRVHVHDEYCAGLAWEDVQVIEVQLAGLRRQRCVEMVRHG
jgi:hypothetical protein